MGRAAAAGAELGLGRLLAPVQRPTSGMDGQTIDDRLRELLGQPVVTSLAITAYRANRKPVLQVFDRRGRTIAFAKVGIDPLTRRLVDAEAEALRVIGREGLRRLRVPAVIAHAPWGDDSLLVTSALPHASPVRGMPALLVAAMREVAGIAPVAVGSVAAYLERMPERLAAVSSSPASGLVEEWRELFERVASSGSVCELSVGAWHGDWTAWNCAHRHGQLVVWDWERFARAVPVGFDALHFRFNQDAGKGWPQARAAASGIVEQADVLLGAWGVRRGAARATAQLYLLDVASRYIADGADPAIVSGRVREWAFPAVRSTLRSV